MVEAAAQPARSRSAAGRSGRQARQPETTAYHPRTDRPRCARGAALRGRTAGDPARHQFDAAACAALSGAATSRYLQLMLVAAVGVLQWGSRRLKISRSRLLWQPGAVAYDEVAGNNSAELRVEWRLWPDDHETSRSPPLQPPGEDRSPPAAGAGQSGTCRGHPRERHGAPRLSPPPHRSDRRPGPFRRRATGSRW